ncbi:MAG: peptidoglycan-binding protein [Eubacteriales bacterium]
MYIGIRGGHQPSCQGANSIVNEVIEDRKIYASVIKFLKLDGNSVLDCTPSNTNSSATDLTSGVNKANNAKVDVFVSIHLNAGGGKGTEVLYFGNSASSKAYATRVCAKIVGLGFVNRNAKADVRGLYEMKHTNMSAIIVECYFLDSATDVALMNKVGIDAIGKAIAEGVVGHSIGGNTISATPISTKPTPIIVTPITPYVTPAQSPIKKGKAFVGNRCLELQQKLNKVMGANIAADSYFGNDSYNLLISFQKKYSLDADGLAGQNVFATLDKVITSMNTTIQFTGNASVLALQKKLNILGFKGSNGLKLSEDGFSGNNTTFATKTCQRWMEVSQDGIAGNNTLSGIDSILAKPFLKLGSKGIPVLYLQNRVGTKSDGTFGKNSEVSVITFQKKNGLVGDGLVGQGTWGALLK